MNRIYAIHYDGVPLVVEAKKRYNAPRPSKRLYYSERDAKIGLKSAYVQDKSKLDVVSYVPESDAQEAIKEMSNALRLTFGGDPELIDHDKLDVIYAKFGIKINEDGCVEEDEDGD